MADVSNRRVGTSTDKEEMHPVTKDLFMSIISMALMGILQDN